MKIIIENGFFTITRFNTLGIGENFDMGDSFVRTNH